MCSTARGPFDFSFNIGQGQQWGAAPTPPGAPQGKLWPQPSPAHPVREQESPRDPLSWEPPREPKHAFALSKSKKESKYLKEALMYVPFSQKKGKIFPS